MRAGQSPERRSENRVLLLEAGVKDNSIMVQMPAGVGGLIGDKGTYNWGFWTEAEPHLNDRKMWWPAR